jgi:hypothetical protein
MQNTRKAEYWKMRSLFEDLLAQITEASKSMDWFKHSLPRGTESLKKVGEELFDWNQYPVSIHQDMMAFFDVFADYEPSWSDWCIISIGMPVFGPNEKGHFTDGFGEDVQWLWHDPDDFINSQEAAGVLWFASDVHNEQYGVRFGSNQVFAQWNDGYFLEEQHVYDWLVNCMHIYSSREHFLINKLSE